MKLFLCSHFSSVGSLIKEEIENKKVAFIKEISEITALLTINQHNAEEERREYDNR